MAQSRSRPGSICPGLGKTAACPGVARADTGSVLFAVCTLLLWTLAGLGSARCARLIGSFPAVRLRLGLAVPVYLVAVLMVADRPWFGPGWWVFVLAGVAHVGFGDWGLFTAYRHLGPRLGMLTCLVLAAPVAGTAEWLWFGDRPTLVQGLCALVALAGVVIALAPRERARLAPGALVAGLVAGVLGSVGQGMGTVITRWGYLLDPEAGVLLPAAWRIWAGFATFLVITPLVARPRPTASQGGRLAPWMALSLVTGPLVGMATYQLAVVHAPSVGLVQAVLATMPLSIIPLAWWLEGDRPSRRSVVGGVVAVFGLVAMLLV